MLDAVALPMRLGCAIIRDTGIVPIEGVNLLRLAERPK